MLAFGLGWVGLFIFYNTPWKKPQVYYVCFPDEPLIEFAAVSSAILYRQIRLKLYRYDMSQNEPGIQKESAVKTCQKAQ